MKKLILFLSMTVLIFFISNCGAGGDNKEQENAIDDITQNPDYQVGLEAISKSDCLTCHRIDEKLTGPSYREVANKYAGMPDTIINHLAGKILQGGGGVWGEIPMVGHPALSKEEAMIMVKYILLLKK